MTAENCATTSLAQLDRQIPLWLRHLAPQLLQILLQSGIVRIFSQGHGKPAIRRRQIARCAKAGRIQRTEGNHGLRIRLVSAGSQHLQTAIAILRHATASINVFFRIDHYRV